MKRCVVLLLAISCSNGSFTAKKASTPPMQRKEAHNNKQKEKKIADFNTPTALQKETI